MRLVSDYTFQNWKSQPLFFCVALSWVTKKPTLTMTARHLRKESTVMRISMGAARKKVNSKAMSDIRARLQAFVSKNFRSLCVESSQFFSSASTKRLISTQIQNLYADFFRLYFFPRQSKIIFIQLFFYLSEYAQNCWREDIKLMFFWWVQYENDEKEENRERKREKKLLTKSTFKEFWLL